MGKLYVFRKGVLIEEYASPDEWAAAYPRFGLYRYDHKDIYDGFKDEPHGFSATYLKKVSWSDKLYFVKKFVYPKVVENEHGTLLKLTTLLGYVREWRSKKRKPFYNTWRHRKTGANYKRMRTMPERRAFYAIDPELRERLIRGKRRLNGLPDSWCEHMSRTSLGWKYQSRRRHQWFRHAKKPEQADCCGESL